MLEILRTPFSSPRSQMFKENICRSVEENEEALYEFCCWSPSTLRLGFDIPGPANIGKTASPTTKCQNTIPKKHATFDKMRKPAENCSSHLISISYIHLKHLPLDLRRNHHKWQFQRSAQRTRESKSLGQWRCKKIGEFLELGWKASPGSSSTGICPPCYRASTHASHPAPLLHAPGAHQEEGARLNY